MPLFSFSPQQPSNSGDTGIVIRNVPGTVDYQPQIQAAIDTQFARGGGEVKLDSGVFPIASPIILRSECKLSGTGNGTVIQAVANLNTWMITNDQTPNVTYRCQVDSLRMDGNAANQSQTATGDNSHGIYFFQKSFSGSGSLDHYYTINNVTIGNCRGNGIFINGAGSVQGNSNFFNIREVKIKGCTVNSCRFAGFRAHRLSDSKIDNSTFAGNRRPGTHLVGTGNMNFTNCKWFYNCGWESNNGDVRLEGANRTTFLGCEVQESYGDGFLITNATQDVLIVGCRIDGNGTAPFAFGGTRNQSGTYVRKSGIRMVNSSQIQVIGCTCTDFHVSGRADKDLNYAWQEWGITIDNCLDVNCDFQSYFQHLGNWRLLNVSSVTSNNIGIRVNNTFPTQMMGSEPMSATFAGRQGETRVFPGHVYYCPANNTWVRAPLSGIWI